jgi:molybdenum cofactor synthesis domain-containing protein
MEVDLRVGILTLSDKASSGQREDESGSLAATILAAEGFSVARQEIIPDNASRIIETLTDWIDRDGLPLIVTSGGTGLSPTDVTPQAMKQVIDYEVPGLAEAMRSASLQKTPHAMLSRAMAGVRKCCLIINLPGSPGGVRDNLTVVLPALKHALAKLQGDPSDCAV